MRPCIFLSLLLLAGCSRPAGVANQADLYNVGEASLHPSAQAVTIGGNGALVPACTARGRVVNLSVDGEASLALRAAPFADADQIGRLMLGTPLFLCQRSMDQHWQGVVIPPDAEPAADCGVATPISAPRGYAGPCRSGWVLGSFVQVADQ